VHGPGDLGLVVGDLVERAVVVVSEDPEPGSLPLDAALAVLEPARRIRDLADAFRPDEELVGAVAETGDADRGVDAVL
jgi:hypothetical protein